jgi:hypothetical protein
MNTERHDIADDFTGRHPATLHLMQHFTYMHLPEGLQDISAECASLASRLAHALPDGPELTAGLRKLLEAKDCFARAALDRAEPCPDCGHATVLPARCTRCSHSQ